jgi:hypothetical protein
MHLRMNDRSRTSYRKAAEILNEETQVSPQLTIASLNIRNR